MPTELAHRVARRHKTAAALRVKNTRVEYSNSGGISAVELARMLERQLGVLVKLRSRPAHRDAHVARRVAVRYMRDSGGSVRVEDEEDDDEPAGDDGFLPTA
jgi:hypothetical protein